MRTRDGRSQRCAWPSFLPARRASISLAALIAFLWVSAASAQGPRTGGPWFRDDCTTLGNPTTNEILCWEQGTQTLKTWNGSAWVPISAGTVTHSAGALTTNAFVLGNAAGDLKALALTGYVKGNGASAPTASSTVPATDLSGTLAAGQFPALTGDVTTSAGALATTLSSTGVSAGSYGLVTVDVKGRVTSAATVNDLAHGGTGLSAAADDTVMVSSGSAWVAKVLTDCQGVNKAVTYTAATNTWGCNTITVGTGTVTNTGALTASAFVIGNGGVDTKPVAITGLVKGNGASDPTAYGGSTCPAAQFATATDANGVLTCGSPAGGGTVTNTAGDLDGNQLVVGNTAADVKKLGSLGTASTVLHGNAGGLPSYSPVALAVDVSGTLLAGNGGTGIGTYTVGDILCATGATTLTATSAVAIGSVYISRGTGTCGVWSTTPVVSGSVTVPLLIGGSTAASVLALQSTSASGVTDAITFATGNQAERMRISASGNVGIGTPSPSVLFDVRGSQEIVRAGTLGNEGLAGLAIKDIAGSGYDTKLEMGVDAALHVGYIQVQAPASFDKPLLLNPSNGNVGIGLTAPTQKLDVAGSINITGQYLVNGSPAGGGTVTHTVGALTASAPVIGNAGGDLKTTAAMTNGQVLLGSTGAAPVPGSIITSTLATTAGAGTFAINIPSTSAGQILVSAGTAAPLIGANDLTWDDTAKKLTLGTGDVFVVVGSTLPTPAKAQITSGTTASPNATRGGVMGIWHRQAVTSVTGCVDRIDPNCGSTFSVYQEKTAASTMQGHAIYAAIVNNSTATSANGGDSVGLYVDSRNNNVNGFGNGIFVASQRNVNASRTGAYESNLGNNVAADCVADENGGNCVGNANYYFDLNTGFSFKGGVAFFAQSIGGFEGKGTGLWQYGFQCARDGMSAACVIDSSDANTYGVSLRGTYAGAAIDVSLATGTIMKVAAPGAGTHALCVDSAGNVTVSGGATC